MIDSELKEFLADCPVLYHMAQRGSWPSIKKYGLLSTSALLDLFDVESERRFPIEAARRPESVEIEHHDIGQAVIRDQKPMDNSGLARCLKDGLTPEQWYRLLNGKVFFWLTRDRLVRLLEARPYRTEQHDVLEVDSLSLIKSYRKSISLCPINSGATKPFPHPRGRDSFLPITDYPYSDWRTKRARGERAVELTVEYGIQDISKFVNKVTVMCGREIEGVIYERS